LPAAMRASFSRATSPANVGADADVPLMAVGYPRTKIRKFSACADTSGIACGNETVGRQAVLGLLTLLRERWLPTHASIRIEESRVGVFGQYLEKPLHGGVLIQRARELIRIAVTFEFRTKRAKTHDVAEPASRKRSCDLRNGRRPPDRRHAVHRTESVNCEHIGDTKHMDQQWAARREIGYESSSVLAVVREA
jgi:hypothetical protein